MEYVRDKKTGEFNTPKDFSEYLFAAIEFYEDYKMVALTPTKYFESEGCMWDQCLCLDMPEGFYEEAEGFYYYEGTVEEARKILRELGATETKTFTEFVKDSCL